MVFHLDGHRLLPHLGGISQSGRNEKDPFHRNENSRRAAARLPRHLQGHERETVPDKLVGHPRTYRLDVCGMCRHLSVHPGKPAEECHCLVRGRIACRNQPFRPDTGRVRQPDYPASLYPE